MIVAGRFRAVRRRDHAVPERQPRPLLERGCSLDVRVLPPVEDGMPTLLVTAGRKTGGAVERNRFRRRTRMALLALLRSEPALASLRGTVWVRPGKGRSEGCQIEYREIEGQLRLALCRWCHHE